MNPRRTLLVCLVGLATIAAWSGFGVWYGNRSSYSVATRVRIGEHQPRIVFASLAESKTYTPTTAQDTIDTYAKSSAVIDGALASPGVRQALAQEADAASFIRATLKVERLGDSDIYAFKMTGRKRDMARYKIVVNAVAQSLVNYLQAEELTRRAALIGALNNELKDAEANLQEVRQQVESHVATADDSPSLSDSAALESKKEELSRAQELRDNMVKRISQLRTESNAPVSVEKLD